MIPPETKEELSQIATKSTEAREPVEFKRVNGKDIPVFEEKVLSPSTIPEQKQPLNVEKPAEKGEIVTETTPKTEIGEAAPQVQEAPTPAIPTTPGEKVPPRAEKGAKTGVVEGDSREVYARKYADMLGQPIKEFLYAFIDKVLNKDTDKLLDYLARGRGQNTNSKKIFTEITGIRLPDTVKGIEDTVYKYTGKERPVPVVKEPPKKMSREEVIAKMKDAKLEKLLNKNIKYSGENMTRKEFLNKVKGQGYLPQAKEIYDTTLQNKDLLIAKRAGQKYLFTKDKAISNENIPEVKEGMEALKRLDKNDYKKTVYRMTKGNSSFDITKTEYDHISKPQEVVVEQPKPEKWNMLSQNERADESGVSKSIPIHPKFNQLKQLIDKEWKKSQGSGAVLEKAPDFQWNYIDYYSEKNPTIASLQKQIAKDVGVNLTPNKTYKQWDLSIPEPSNRIVKPELPPIPPKEEGKKTYLEGLSEEKFKLGGIKEGDSPFKQLEAFQRSQIIDIEKQIAKAKPDFDFAKARKESIGNANLRVYDLETGMKYLDHLEQNYATIKTPKEKPAPSPKTGHWIETQNKEWFGFLKGNNITPDNAKTKLGVKSMKEYTGTIDDAKKIVLAKEEPKMQAPVKVDDKKAPETPSLQERIREKVADRVLSSTLPEAKRQEIIDFVDKAIKNNPKLNMTESMRSKFITQFKERIGLLAKEYGVAGGELGQKMADANIKQQGYLENGYENFIDKVTDIYNDFDIEQRTEVNSLVFDALENRDDSSEILRDNKDAQKVYEIAKDFWDEFKKTLTSKGYATREDYISHAKDTFSIDNILSDIKDIDEADIRDLNNYIKEKSRFLQKRKDADIELLRDIPSLMKSYLHSVAKALSYKDVVEFYYKDFKKNIPVAFKNRSKQTAISYMTDNLNPEIGKGGIYKVIKNIRRNLYFNFLYMNLKYAAQNYPQKILTQLYTSKEAQKMTNRIFYINRSIEGNLQNATQEAQQINPRFTELVKDIEGATKSDKIRDVIEKYDIGKLSEISNWSYAEIAGIVDYLMKVPEYKGLVKGGMTPKQAFNKLLENQDTYNGAVRSGRDLASKTQISPAPAYRPEVFARPLNRALLMFQRFRFATIEMLSETMGKLEGAEGGRALSVLRRGLSGEADDVEVLRSVETLRKNIENVFKEYKKAKKSPELSVSNDEIDSYLNYLKFQEKELNNALKQKAPLGGSKSQIAKTWGKWYGIAVGISVAFQYLYEMRDDFVRGIIGKDEKKNKQTAARRVFRVLNDVSPLNTYNPSPFSTPIIPSFTNQMFIYGNFNKRGMFSAGVRYGFNVLPGLGFLDVLTGRVGSDAITNIVSPPKNKKKSKKED